jgi:hypothetical protein
MEFRRNPFVNQVSSFIEHNDNVPWKQNSRNPFVNQVSSFFFDSNAQEDALWVVIPS